MIGILVLDIEEGSLYEMINNVEFAKQENIFIIDLDGYIVSNSNKALLGKPLFSEKERTEILASKEDILTFGSGKNTKFILHKTISSNGWRIIVEIPSSDILKNYKSYNNMISYILTITVIVIFVFTVFIIAAIMVERLTLRVKNLTQVIETVGIDNYGQNANFYGYIDRLEYSIHNMLDTVKRLVEESYQAKVHEKEAQLYALQAQINPHFLYNTLDTINWMAIKQGTNDISILVDSLAKYFRLVLSKGKDIVTIQEEINLIKVYLDIQRARFGDKYIVEYNISNEVNEYSIPKFTLQPIIENALEHGIQKKKDRRGTINIQAEKKDSDIQFIISDNGIGIQQEYLEKILDPPTGAINKGYGLYNVHQRLILFSDNNKAYGLKISSKENVGTTVVITLKAAK
jgi:two-component system sensor histidine kinase YesM